MVKNDSIGDRMKNSYENRTRISLPRRTHTIIRIDGKAFHTYTKGMQRPYDLHFMADMDATAKVLCENIMGAKMAFVQSDEISILMSDYDNIGTEAWFDGNIQKICSISASIATAEFNKLRACIEYASDINQKLALFDARCFTIPDLVEVHNYFVWRQQDCERNSVQMLGQAHFSHTELQNQNCSQIQDMLMLGKGVNWNDEPAGFKRGRVVIRKAELELVGTEVRGASAKETYAYRTSWTISEAPRFTQEIEFVGSQVTKPWKKE